MDYFEKLTLNGKSYSGVDLVNLVNAKLNSKTSKEFEKHLYSFIKEWISLKKLIKVKTSGTTGEPKEMIFSKYQAITSAKMTCEYFGLIRNTNALLCLSSEYIGGKMMIVRAFVSGMNLITIESNGNPLEGLSEKIDFASIVPLQVLNCLQDDETKSKFLSIPNIIIGGAPVSLQLETLLANCTNNVYSTFAMTETLSHIALRKLSGNDRADYFETFPGVTVLKDARGCLSINAAGLNNDLIITNDVVEIITPTRFRWLGRYDNVINSGGIKIHPEVVEKKLSLIVENHPFFIGSLPDDKLGQKVVMVIESPERFDINGIKNAVKNILSKYEIPKEYYWVEKFVKTPTGKVKKEETLKIATSF